MQASYRFGDEVSAGRYPLPVSTAPVWTGTDRCATASIAVPPCPRGHILVPSVSLPGQKTGFQCSLEAAGERWTLHAVPGNRPDDEFDAPTRANGECAAAPRADDFSVAVRPGGGAISTHIDCFHTERQLPESRLWIRLARPDPPRRFLLALSIRPLIMNPAVPPPTRLVLGQPPPISQMQGPAPIRKRICSPTALAMLLRAARPEIPWQSVVDACCDGRFYGSWPLAIHSAARHGRLGAVEAIGSWDPALGILGTGSPVVASIRFGPGELPGAPLRETTGHLVTVHGIDDDRVLVCDPAAPDADSVPREYGLAAFTAAWMRHRGAAYLFAPP